MKFRLTLITFYHIGYMLYNYFRVFRHRAAGHELEHGFQKVHHNVASFADDEVDSRDFFNAGRFSFFLDDLNERAHQRHFMHRIETSFLNLLKEGCRNARHCGSPRIIRSTDYLKIFGLAVNYSLSPVKSNRVPRWMRSLAKNLLVSR